VPGQEACPRGTEGSNPLSRPGGNVTGFSIFSFDLISKRLELLSELVPQAGVITLLVDPNNSNADRIIGDAQEAALGRRIPARDRFAPDSPLEGSGFELLVPVRQAKLARSCR
jgi:hypothetical protein